MRRPGLWVANGSPSDADKMLSWQPGALTSFYDYLGPNKVRWYKQQHPEIPVIIRFQHPKNWRENFEQSARDVAELVISKWPDMRDLDPYVYYANEMNLHYENGDEWVGNQWKYETPEFYELNAKWILHIANRIKQRVPEMKLVCPPTAFGHHEDGAPDDNGNPKDGWAGYDYLADGVRAYFGNILTFHAYWGHSGGAVPAWLYDHEQSSWYAFRWRRLLKLFETRYGIQAKLIIDEAGNMDAGSVDFTDQVLYYSNECLKDPRVLALTYFLWEDPTFSAGNMMNSWVQKIGNLSEHLKRLREMPPVALPPTPPEVPDGIGTSMLKDIIVKVQTDDGIVSVSIIDFVRGTLSNEMAVTSVANGGSYDEALKAHIVEMFTYLWYRKLHPRNIEYHVGRGDFAFDINDIGEYKRVDDLVALMDGVELRKRVGDGYSEFEAECVSRCGRDAIYCAECSGNAGYVHPRYAPDGHWPGRFCQDGANEWAKRGLTYDQILMKYYGDQGVCLRDMLGKRNFGGNGCEEPGQEEETETGTGPEDNSEGELEMTDRQKWVSDALKNVGKNEAAKYGVSIVPAQATGKVLRCINVHVLDHVENGGFPGMANAFIIVLGEDNKEVFTAKANYEWTGMKSSERPQPVPLDKRENESPSAIWINPKFVDLDVKLVMDGVVDSDEVKGLTTQLPDDGLLHTGHFSYTLVYKVVQQDTVPVVPPEETPVVIPDPIVPPPLPPDGEVVTIERLAEIMLQCEEAVVQVDLAKANLSVVIAALRAYTNG